MINIIDCCLSVCGSSLCYIQIFQYRKTLRDDFEEVPLKRTEVYHKQAPNIMKHAAMKGIASVKKSIELIWK
jgi:adenylate kinase family enzyme